MERFSIDDAIKLSKIIANRYKWSAENADMGSEDANELHADICNQYVKEHEQIAEWLEELKSYKDIGTLKELKEFKENGAFTGVELAKLAIMQKELKKYKDLEEQGLLVRLPCKVGDDVYIIPSPSVYGLNIINGYENLNRVYHQHIGSITFADSHWYATSREEYKVYNEKVLNDIAFGITWFTDREEAEKKLEEMKND